MEYKYFFNNKESKAHKEAKEKLFDLIIQDKVKILDNYNREYYIYVGFEEEFLHMESFLINYHNEAIYSNYDLPCVKHLNFNKEEYVLLCDLKGHWGVFETLPCKKCIEINYIGDKNIIGYTPDIAYGYDGKHQIWLEINHKHKCTKQKIDYCRDNNIILLEINSKDVLDFNETKNNNLIFNNLSNDRYNITFDKKVYFAGKINQHDWRHSLFNTLRIEDEYYYEKDGFIYNGPYFISCDHGCNHGNNTHGRGVGLEDRVCRAGDLDSDNYEEHKKEVTKKCINWINKSDIIFVWVDKPDIYGTLVEIGIAKQMGKFIFIAFKEDEKFINDMWFASTLANYSVKVKDYNEAWNIFTEYYIDKILDY